MYIKIQQRFLIIYSVAEVVVYKPLSTVKPQRGKWVNSALVISI